MNDQNQIDSALDMFDSSDECDTTNHVFYRERQEWKDVEPIEQDDGPAKVVQIAYSQKFLDVYDYFRAIVKTQEISQRALELVTDAIALNPANYTAWTCRLELVKELKIDLHDEVKYISDVIRQFTKNYQVWQYRKNIIEILNDPSGELEFTAEILDLDAKNYHAWQYRQWILTTHSHLLKNELNYIEDLISQDIRNNSAWNQRYFVINNSAPYYGVIDKEIDYTFEKINILTKNESAWNYLKGLLCFFVDDKSENISKDNEKKSKQFKTLVQKILNFCTKLYNKGNRSIHLMACMIEFLTEHNEKDQELNEPIDIEKIKFALKLCYELAITYDPLRIFYWAYISKGIEKRFKIKDRETEIDITKITPRCD